jgi:hypothetical protein
MEHPAFNLINQQLLELPEFISSLCCHSYAVLELKSTLTSYPLVQFKVNGNHRKEGKGQSTGQEVS